MKGTVGTGTGVSRGKNKATGIVDTLVGASLWGFSGACAQLLYRNPAITPEFVTMVRALVTFLILGCAALLLFRKRFFGLLQDKASRGRLLLYGIGLFGSQIAYAFSVQATNAGTATVLQSLFMVVVMAFTCITLRHLPRIAEVVGLVLALAGTWLIVTGGNPSSISLPASGLLWCLANILSVAVYVIAPKSLYDTWGSFPVIAAGMMISALCSLVFWAVTALPSGTPMPALNMNEAVLLVVGVAIIGTVIAFALYLSGVAMVGPILGSLLSTAEPLSAVVLSAVWLATPFKGTDFLGMAFVIGMIIVVSLPSRQPRKQRSARKR